MYIPEAEASCFRSPASSFRMRLNLTKVTYPYDDTFNKVMLRHHNKIFTTIVETIETEKELGHTGTRTKSLSLTVHALCDLTNRGTWRTFLLQNFV